MQRAREKSHLENVHHHHPCLKPHQEHAAGCHTAQLATCNSLFWRAANKGGKDGCRRTMAALEAKTAEEEELWDARIPPRSLGYCVKASTLRR